MEDDDAKRLKVDLLKLATFVLQRLKKVPPDERQDFVTFLRIPDDILTEIHSMLPKRSDLKPVFKAEMDKRGIEAD